MDRHEDGVPKAVRGVRELRDSLKATIPEFRAAARAGEEADHFVRSVRADLAARRKRAGFDQEDIGRTLDLGQPAISKIENGHGDLGLKTLYRYARAAGYRPVVLLVPTARTVATELAGAASAPLDARIEPASVGIERAQVELLRRMSGVIPEVLAHIIDKPE